MMTGGGAGVLYAPGGMGGRAVPSVSPLVVAVRVVEVEIHAHSGSVRVQLASPVLSLSFSVVFLVRAKVDALLASASSAVSRVRKIDLITSGSESGSVLAPVFGLAVTRPTRRC